LILVIESTSKLNTIKILLDIKDQFSRIFILSNPFSIPLDGNYEFINNIDSLSEYIYIKDTCKVNKDKIIKFKNISQDANKIYAANKYDDIFILFCMITGKIQTYFKEFEPDYLKCISKIDKSIMDNFDDNVVDILFKVNPITDPKMYKYNKHKTGELYYTGIII
jgi:hypothetical protein